MATYYVGPSSAGAADGTSWANRYGTLNAAEDRPLTAGDTVYVGAGTYRELLTCDVSGTSGNPITYIGDYTGASTDGVGGVVRVTGSADDIAQTRANCVLGAAKSYRTFSGFTFDIASGQLVKNTSGTNWIVEDCLFQGGWGGTAMNGTATTCTMRRCVFVLTSAAGGTGLMFSDEGAGDQSDTANVVENCIIIGGNQSHGIQASNIGGVTVRNSFICGFTNAIRTNSLTAGQVITVNNCLIVGNGTGFSASASGEITEDYNAIYGNGTARTNTSTGGNSNVYPTLFDPRWFLEMTRNGGTLVSAFDLAGYGALDELNSGTGAPSADMRGTTVQGTYREWGPLEYDSTLDIEASSGSSSGGMGGIFGSIVR